MDVGINIDWSIHAALINWREFDHNTPRHHLSVLLRKRGDASEAENDPGLSRRPTHILSEVKIVTGTPLARASMYVLYMVHSHTPYTCQEVTAACISTSCHPEFRGDAFRQIWCMCALRSILMCITKRIARGRFRIGSVRFLAKPFTARD
jgi:hypothetical protein